MVHDGSKNINELLVLRAGGCFKGYAEQKSPATPTVGVGLCSYYLDGKHTAELVIGFESELGHSMETKGSTSLGQ